VYYLPDERVVRHIGEFLNTMKTTAMRDIYEAGFDEDVRTESSANRCPECDGHVTAKIKKAVCEDCGIVVLENSEWFLPLLLGQLDDSVPVRRERASPDSSVEHRIATERTLDERPRRGRRRHPPSNVVPTRSADAASANRSRCSSRQSKYR
jgi:hypothetical protein